MACLSFAPPFSAPPFSAPPLSGSLKTDRKSTRLNSSHQIISYAVFCLKKKKTRRPVSELIPHHHADSIEVKAHDALGVSAAELGVCCRVGDAYPVRIKRAQRVLSERTL